MKTISTIDKFISTVVRHGESAVDKLVDSGVDPNSIATSGRTPLSYAASEGLLEIVNRLLAAKASVNAPGDYGMTALHEAATNGHTATVVALIDSGATVDAKTTDEVTPLMCASAWGHIEVVAVLLDRGADSNLKDKRGDTAFDIACERGETTIAEFLEPKRT